MKTIFKILLLTFIFTSCELPDVNQESKPLTEVYKKQMPLADHLVGNYETVKDKGAKGLITITKEVIDINLEGYQYHLQLDQYTTLTNLLEDCYFDIYLSNGIVIRISDWIVYDDTIWLKINGKLIAVLKRVGDKEPEIIPEEPILN